MVLLVAPARLKNTQDKSKYFYLCEAVKQTSLEKLVAMKNVEWYLRLSKLDKCT